MNPEEREQLLDHLLDGEISEADFLRLEAELTVDGDFRAHYYDRLQLDWLLEREAKEHVETPAPVIDPPKSGWSVPGPLWVGLLLGVAASLLFVVAVFPRQQGTPGALAEVTPVSTDEPSASGFAVLSGCRDAVWASETSQSLDLGSLLPSGQLHLESGLAHLELFSGVQLVVQGDAVFTIDSPMQVTMHRGRARAHVPEPAQGFRIKTSHGEVVDLGTEFTVDVGDSGADVNVVDGEVEIHTDGTAARKVLVGQSWQLAADGQVKESNRSIDIVGPAAFQREQAQNQAHRIERWTRASEELRDDPRLVAYYQVDPQERWSRQLENLSHRDAGRASDGAVVAAGRAEDRWGREGGALDFSQMGSRVRVSVPGEFRGLTLMCWVKINSLDRWYNSLFLTDGHQEREPHWQIMDDGRLFFSVKLPEGAREKGTQQHHIFYSPPFWETSLSGRWIMLATTYDVDSQRVTHFLNGEPISSEEIPNEWLVDNIKIDSGSICNWSEPMYRTDPNFVVRNLNGNLDEFAIFSGALSQQEVLTLYQTGNPNEL